MEIEERTAISRIFDVLHRYGITPLWCSSGSAEAPAVICLSMEDALEFVMIFAPEKEDECSCIERTECDAEFNCGMHGNSGPAHDETCDDECFTADAEDCVGRSVCLCWSDCICPLRGECRCEECGPVVPQLDWKFKLGDHTVTHDVEVSVLNGLRVSVEAHLPQTDLEAIARLSDVERVNRGEAARIWRSLRRDHAGSVRTQDDIEAPAVPAKRIGPPVLRLIRDETSEHVAATTDET